MLLESDDHTRVLDVEDDVAVAIDARAQRPVGLIYNSLNYKFSALRHRVSFLVFFVVFKKFYSHKPSES